MDLIGATLEDKSKAEEIMDSKVVLEIDVTKPEGEEEGIPFYSKVLDLSKTAVKDDSQVSDVTRQGGEMVQNEASCKVLEVSKSTEGDHTVAGLSESVMDAVEDGCNALNLCKAALENGSSEAGICEQLPGITTELNSEALDVSRAVSNDESTVLDIPDATDKTVVSEATLLANVESCKSTSADVKVLEMHDTVHAAVEMEVIDLHQAATQNVQMTSSIPDHVGETVTDTMATGGVNQAALEVENSEVSKKTANDDSDVDVLNVKQPSEAESRAVVLHGPEEDSIAIKSKTSDEPDPCASLTVDDKSVEDRPLAEEIRISKDMEKEEICIGHMGEDCVKEPSQTAHTLGTSDSKCSSHNTVQNRPLEGSNALQKTEGQTDQSITCSAELQGADVNAEISRPSPELSNEEMDGAGVPCEANPATSRSASGTSPELLTGNEEQESREDEDDIQQLLQEIKTHLTEKDISIEKLKFDYSSYGLTVGGKVKFTHVIEIYDFMPDLNTEDIMEVFAEFQKSEFRLQWVDSTHALGLFSTEEAANKALAMTHPLLKFRPLFEASIQSKNKAYQCIGEKLAFP
ncbi:uncharacterized protein LOC144791788 isoform X2 [Lissotriton helveticus]